MCSGEMQYLIHSHGKVCRTWWSEPMRILAGKFTISDRGLAKACAAANVPVPERGYWSKLQAGHKVSKTPLPARGLGQPDEITIGRTPKAGQ